MARRVYVEYYYIKCNTVVNVVFTVRYMRGVNTNENGKIKRKENEFGLFFVEIYFLFYFFFPINVFRGPDGLLIFVYAAASSLAKYSNTYV